MSLPTSGSERDAPHGARPACDRGTQDAPCSDSKQVSSERCPACFEQSQWQYTPSSVGAARRAAVYASSAPGFLGIAKSGRTFAAVMPGRGVG